jgi:hypothetical protein
MRTPIALIAASSFALASCATTLNAVVDPATISDQAKYAEDRAYCEKVAKTYDLSADTGMNAAAGGAAGGVAVAGIAYAVAGAVFAPAIPFIIAGSLAGGGLAGGLTQQKETEAREKVLKDCLESKGYKAFG